MIELTKENKSLFYDASGLDLQTLIDLVNRKNKNIFTLDNFIDDRELNELGVQVYRALAYDQRFDELRRNSALFNSDRHKELKKNGFLKIENFLNTEEFTIIQKAATKAVEDSKKYGNCANLPLNIDVTSSKKIQDICRLCQASELFTLKEFYFRKITHMVPGEYCEDARQYNYHIDKFYPNYKIWFYPFDIEELQGPTGLYRGSQKHTIEKLKWHYQTSLLSREEKESGTWSRLHLNVTDHQDPAKKLGFGDEVICSAKANTFYIIDTRCFHRRTPAEAGTHRFSFRAILDRKNVF
tara:strand:+ start:3959 stop:4849 length:891 start_codon:yes stop_codon:yes gene_type:complete